MNRLPSHVTLLSVVGAVVLWYIATLLEGDRAVEPAAVPAAGEAPAFGRQTRETGVVGGAAALRCEEAERAMQQLVDEARYCEYDADCTIFDYGYPIQCLMSVNRDEITRLRLEFRDYEQACEHRVYYDCPSGAMERRPVCSRNRCEVVLESLHDLRDETLQHLGIDEVR